MGISRLRRIVKRLTPIRYSMKVTSLKKCALLLLAIPMALASCNGTSGGANTDAADTAVMADTASLSALTLGLGLIRDGLDQGSTCVSPVSLQSVLRLAAAGAVGQTKAELCRIAGCPADPQFPAADATEVTFESTNAVWIDNGLTLAPAYSEAVRGAHRASVQALPLRQNGAESAAAINAWAKESTKGMVQEVVQPNDFTANTNLVLTNATYFKGRWAEPFQREEVQEGLFHSSAGERKVMMMSKMLTVPYFQSDNMQVLQLSYAGERYKLMFILPMAEAPSIDALRGLTADSILRWASACQQSEVLLSIPKFKIEQQSSLSNALVTLGMRLPFTSEANFSAITGSENGIFMDNVLQSAAIDVNEEGTEAAAVTAASMMSVSLNQLQFVADRPFLYVLYDTTPENALFVGTYDPR